MSGPTFNRTGDSVCEKDYIELWETDQEKTQRILKNNEAAVLENKRVLYILNLERIVESFEAELTKLHFNMRICKERRQKLVNKNSLLRVCLQYEVKKLMRDRVMNMQMVEEIRRLRIYLEGASGMRTKANAWGFPRMFPQQDLIVNSEVAPSASDNDVRSNGSSSDVKLEKASPSTHRPVKRAKHAH